MSFTKSKRFDCWNFGYKMSKILGIKTPSGKIIPRWKLEDHNNKQASYNELKKTEFYWDAIEVCQTLMIQGSFRYGRLNAPGKPNWDRISDAIRRLKLYKETHNLLHLYDAMNMIGLETEEGKHQDRHFLLEDDVIHTEIKK